MLILGVDGQNPCARCLFINGHERALFQLSAKLLKCSKHDLSKMLWEYVLSTNLEHARTFSMCYS